MKTEGASSNTLISTAADAPRLAADGMKALLRTPMMAKTAGNPITMR